MSRASVILRASEAEGEAMSKVPTPTVDRCVQARRRRAAISFLPEMPGDPKDLPALRHEQVDHRVFKARRRSDRLLQVLLQGCPGQGSGGGRHRRPAAEFRSMDEKPSPLQSGEPGKWTDFFSTPPVLPGGQRPQQQRERERTRPPRSLLLAYRSPLPSTSRAAAKRGSMQRQQLPTNG